MRERKKEKKHLAQQASRPANLFTGEEAKRSPSEAEGCFWLGKQVSELAGSRDMRWIRLANLQLFTVCSLASGGATQTCAEDLKGSLRLAKVTARTEMQS